MGGGLMQLLFVGQQDIYLKSNPSITFFKKIFKTHTNFAMQSIRVDFNKTDTNIYEKTTLKLKIPRHGDLLAQTYFVLELPEIISDNILCLKWIENIGEALIDNYYITIGGSLIDKHTGEYLHIMNSLTCNSEKKNMYNNMTGNIALLNNPIKYAVEHDNISIPPRRYRIANGYPVYIPYDPNNPNAYTPSIPTRKIYIPLRFWFNKDIGNALPLISLQYSEVELTIELRPWIQLYQLMYSKSGVSDYYAPNLAIGAHHLKNFVSNVTKKFLISDSVIDSKCYLEANYIFLDEVERQYFAYKPLDYLIEQVTIVNQYNIQGNTTIDMILQNPVKELIWVLKRNDISVKNDWFNFTDRYNKILHTSKILFNGVDRFDEKDAEYFNYLQVYQHHTGAGKDGLYTYNFSINPEDYQPSGSCNMSRINNIQFYMTTKDPNDGSYSYDITLYAINYNFLRIASGLSGLVYSV